MRVRSRSLFALVFAVAFASPAAGAAPCAPEGSLQLPGAGWGLQAGASEPSGLGGTGLGDEGEGLGGTGLDAGTRVAASDEPGGLGGTGLGDEPEGLGGTGQEAEPEGLGGTGVYGVVTGFGSICVNGVRIAYGDETPTEVNRAPSSAGALRVGESRRARLFGWERVPS